MFFKLRCCGIRCCGFSSKDFDLYIMDSTHKKPEGILFYMFLLLPLIH
jgi:hypothetical protein